MNRQMPSTAKRTHRVDRRLSTILGIACVIRLAFVLLYPQLVVVNDAAAYDQEGYHIAFSHGVLEGNDGPIVISKGPVYPIFLAAIYRVVGYHHTAVRVVQALLSTWSVFLIYKVAQMVFPPGVALIASALAALYPPLISYSGLLLTEVLSVALLLVFVYSVLKGISKPTGKGWWIVAGVWGGILLLHREEMLLLLAGLMVAGWRYKLGSAQLGLLLGSMALLALPWVVRNYRTYQVWLLAPPSQGAKVWFSTYAARWQVWDNGDPYYRSVVDVPGLSPVQRDRQLLREGLRQVVEHPRIYASMCVQRIPQFWIGGHSETIAHLEQSLGSCIRQRAYLKASLKSLMLLYNLSLIAFGLAGMYLAWKEGMTEKRQLVVLGLPVLTTVVVHIVLAGGLRYQVPIMSFVIIFAAWAMWSLRHLVRTVFPAHG